jgi:hypothetical protein
MGCRYLDRKTEVCKKGWVKNICSALASAYFSFIFFNSLVILGQAQNTERSCTFSGLQHVTWVLLPTVKQSGQWSDCLWYPLGVRVEWLSGWGRRSAATNWGVGGGDRQQVYRMTIPDENVVQKWFCRLDIVLGALKGEDLAYWTAVQK